MEIVKKKKKKKKETERERKINDCLGMCPHSPPEAEL